MLGSPLGAVVAASDVEATTAFLTGFDLVVTGSGEDFVDLASAERGRLRVVHCSEPAVARGAFDGGPAALDFYCRSVAHLPSVRIDLGPLVMNQARLTGPDGLPIVLIDASHRRPSRLDSSDAEFSEAHSLVWVVPSIEQTLPFFQDAGMSVAFDLPLGSPAVAELMALPRRDVPIRMAMLSDEAVNPMRLELFEFPADGTTAFDGVVRAGTVWPVFQVADLDAALALPWASTGPVTAGSVRCVAPGGVLVELWS